MRSGACATSKPRTILRAIVSLLVFTMLFAPGADAPATNLDAFILLSSLLVLLILIEIIVTTILASDNNKLHRAATINRYRRCVFPVRLCRRCRRDFDQVTL